MCPCKTPQKKKYQQNLKYVAKVTINYHKIASSNRQSKTTISNFLPHEHHQQIQFIIGESNTLKQNPGPTWVKQSGKEVQLSFSNSQSLEIQYELSPFIKTTIMS